MFIIQSNSYVGVMCPAVINQKIQLAMYIIVVSIHYWYLVMIIK